MERVKLIPLVLIISILLSAVVNYATPQKPVKGESLRKGEMRATLNPDLFSDPIIKRAYQVAKEIPWILDSIFCYCYCEDPPFMHKSLLSCYVDDHAAM